MKRKKKGKINEISSNKKQNNRKRNKLEWWEKSLYKSQPKLTVCKLLEKCIVGNLVDQTKEEKIEKKKREHCHIARLV